MKKIVIVGSPGAGKSTLAQALARILKIEAFHLDHYFWEARGNHFWRPYWKEFSREERMVIEQQLLQQHEQWIIEGSYFGSSDSRLNAADTIIFLDMPRLLCLWQALKRYIKYHGYTRPDIPEGETEQLSLSYILKILVFPHRSRKLFFEKIAALRKRGIQVKSVEFSHNNHKLFRQQVEMLCTHKSDAPSEKFVLHFQSHNQVDEFLWKLAAKKSAEQPSKKLLAPQRTSSQVGTVLRELLAKEPKARFYEAPKPIRKPI